MNMENETLQEFDDDALQVSVNDVKNHIVLLEFNFDNGGKIILDLFDR